MLAIINNSLREKLRNKSFYLFSVLVLIFLVFFQTSGTLVIDEDEITGIADQLRLGIHLVSFFSGILVVMVSLDTIGKEFERKTTHLVLVRGIKKYQFVFSLALSNIFLSLIGYGIIYLSLYLFVMVKGEMKVIQPLIQIMFLSSINIVLISITTSLLSLIMPLFANGIVSILILITGSLHQILYNFLKTRGGSFEKIFKLVLKLVPNFHKLQAKAANLILVVLKAKDGLEALNILENDRVDIAVIDIMMPKLDGFNLIKKLRENLNIPVIILSARNLDSDIILGLDLGADDYMVKSFNPLELVARVNSQLRRYYNFNKGGGHGKEVITIGDIELNMTDKSVKLAGNELILTSSEYKILELLLTYPGRIFTKREIFEYIREEEYYCDDNTIMVHISNLRDKLGDSSKEPRYIRTIRGLGYRMEKI